MIVDDTGHNIVNLLPTNQYCGQYHRTECRYGRGWNKEKLRKRPAQPKGGGTDSGNRTYDNEFSEIIV